MTGFTGLTPGTVYYADTRGDLVEGNIGYGRMSGYSVLDDYIETAGVILTLDALVGLAVSNTSVLLGAN